MSALTLDRQVQWQDLKVRSELDIVFEVAAKEGWKDCEMFGHGDMITQSQESTGWKLIPADQYNHSIPIEAIKRLHQVINAGVRVQGVIIADDGRRAEPPPTPARPKASLSAVTAVASFIGKALLRLICFVICAAGVIALVVAAAYFMVSLAPILTLGLLVGAVSGKKFDPKLVVLVEDGNGGTTWVSLFTWYE
jgi:hypothetical protein